MQRLGRIGNGTFGIVYSARANGGGEVLAVKRNLVEQHIDFSGCIRELDLLNKVKDHPYIVRLLELTIGNPFARCPSPHGAEGMRDDSFHFVMEKGDYDLFHLLYESKDKPLMSVFKGLMVQMLLGLEFLHKSKIIHRDIKNNNILIYRNGRDYTVKICDFGMAKPYTRQAPLTPKISSATYRAPELTVDDEGYDYRCDVWSMGCILYEIVAGTPFMITINDEPNTIIRGVLERLPRTISEEEFNRVVNRGRPSTSQTSARVRYPGVCNQARNWEKKLESKINRAAFNSSSGSLTQFASLLDGMMQFDYQKRFTVTQALDHPFFEHHRGKITQIRQAYPPLSSKLEVLSINDGQERQWGLALAEVIFQERHKFYWYTHRAFFLSLDLFDRYLSLRNEDETTIEPTREETEIRFLVCMYIAMKYFVTLFSQVPYREIVPEAYQTQSSLLYAEEFETVLVTEILVCNVYRDTLIEAADEYGDKLNEEDIISLFNYHKQAKILQGSTYHNVYHLYRNLKRLKGRALKIVPRTVKIK